jgi:hypothetical protein
MIALLRTSIGVSLLAMLAVAILPFDRPHEATFAIDQPPVLSMLAILAALSAFALLAVAAFGLLRFRRWAPRLATATAIYVAALGIALVLVQDLGSIISAAAKFMTFLSAFALALAVFLTRTAELKERFRVAL